MSARMRGWGLVREPLKIRFAAQRRIYSRTLAQAFVLLIR